jgi:hypothetical protein
MRRLGCIALLIFQALWLNVILPGHTRGIIALPGARGASKASTCCTDSKSKPDAPAKPAPRPSACAVCFFAARLTLPEVIDLSPPALGLLDTIDIPLAQQVVDTRCLIPFNGRGPPLV